MLQIRRICGLGAAAAAGLVFSSGLRAAVIAADSASNSPYVAGGDTIATEFNGLNGGSGFGPWVVTDVENYTGTTPPPTLSNGPGTGNGDAFAANFNTEASNDTVTPGGALRNPAPVFDVFDNGNPNSSSSTGAALGSSIVTAVRPFLTPLAAGGSFSFTDTLHSLRGANAGVPTSQVGFELLDSSGNVLLDLYVNGGGAGYEVTDYNHSAASPLLIMSTDSAHSGSSSRVLDINGSSSDTITISLIDTITEPNGDIVGDYSITTTGHRASTYADTGMQILLAPGGVSNGGPSAFAIFNNNGGQGSDVAVNGLTETGTAVPEPVSGAIVGLGLVALGRRRRR